MTRYDHQQNTGHSQQMIHLRPRDRNVWDRDHVLHETEPETKTNYCKIETEIRKWSQFWPVTHPNLVTQSSHSLADPLSALLHTVLCAQFFAPNKTPQRVRIAVDFSPGSTYRIVAKNLDVDFAGGDIRRVDRPSDRLYGSLYKGRSRQALIQT